MKVAVLIPLYNHERYIAAALASLRAQTRPPDRVIVVDDGSTDGSLAAVTPFPGLEVVTQANAGAHAALNRAVELAADCDYLAILNSDDCYHPRRIEACLEYLDQHSAVALVCTRLRLIDAAGQELPPDAPRARWFSAAWDFRLPCADLTPPDLAEWLGIANFPGTTSNFFARAADLRAHPFANYRFAHDYSALIAAALENRLGIVDEVLLDYRIHDHNTISTQPESLIREMLRLNVDLARAVAPRLAAEPALRENFARYQRATWRSLSAFRADVFQVLLAETLAATPATAVDALLAAFDAGRFPEIAEFPNKSSRASADTSGLADQFYTLKSQLSSVRAAARAWAQYRQVQATLLGSRWFALGSLLGLTQAIRRAGGKTGPEKLAILRERLTSSRWLTLGVACGSSTARRLRQFASTGKL